MIKLEVTDILVSSFGSQRPIFGSQTQTSTNASTVPYINAVKAYLLLKVGIFFYDV